VIKVEIHRGRPDAHRGPSCVMGASTMFGQLNVGKQSIVLDLKATRGGRGGEEAGGPRSIS